MVLDLRMMFEYFQQEGLKAAPEALERQAKLIGHAPRSFAAFAAETAAAWQGPAGNLTGSRRCDIKTDMFTMAQSACCCPENPPVPMLRPSV